ncbi:MAG TPA: hypothetical protein VHD34_05585 [Xanthobacteraceae bacterium]|nr:hypothetical protein [Xanthobacteraceae bacterium]
MSSGRVLMIGLDAFEISLAEVLMDRGELPHFRKLRERSARFRLDHGRDKFSGLSWEHVCGGVSPSDGARWSAVHFDRDCYSVSQRSTTSCPFFADLGIAAAVFDVPYCDLRKVPSARGLVNWGSHDPGVARVARPDGLAEEMAKTFGPYPAKESIYGFCWPSAERAKILSDQLARAVAVRAKAARWMFAEKLPDWKLGMMVVSEAHSGIESLWHGVDRAHPLHGIPSAAAAKAGLEKIYRAIDALIGEMADAFPDAQLVLFSMHGMGRNEADVAAMLLLPELMYRHAFGKPYARDIAWPASLPDGTPLLAKDASWDEAMKAVVPELGKKASGWRRLFGAKASTPGGEAAMSMDWMAAARYRNFWPQMRAFALPSFYDGRIRINLQGREANGIVARTEYDFTRNEIVDLLRGCRNAQTGEPIAEEIIPSAKDPQELGPSDADVSVIFRDAPVGITHPRLGAIGPYPWRRTGGHTGESGFLYLTGSAISAGDYGRRSSFDVVPTVIDLLGRRPQGVSGKSILRDLRTPVPA